MATIRNEINILDAVLSAAGGASATSNEIVQLDTNQYSGTPTYYFEVVGDSTISISFNVTLRRKGTSTDDATCNIPLLTTNYALVRSASFSPPAGQTEYVIFIDATAGATKNVKSARIVIIQNSGPLTSTETQIEIGSASTVTATSIPTGATNMTNPKYWKYTSANWDGTLSVALEATFKGSTSKTACSVALQHDDGSFGATWTTDTTITTTATTPTRVRSGVSFTLVAGRNYRIVGAAAESKTGMTIYNAKIIVLATNGSCLGAGNPSDNVNSRRILGGTAASGETEQAYGQAILLGANGTITGCIVNFKKTGAPSDNAICDLVTSLTGSALATGSVSGASLSTSYSLVTFTFSSPYNATSGTQYYVRFTRSGVRDITNYFNLGASNGLPTVPYVGGFEQDRDNNSWTASTTNWIYVSLLGPIITKFEPQYLLANTAFAAGAALQTFLTKWDSTEWSGVTNVYTHQLESNVSANVVELDTAAGIQLVGSPITTSGTTSKIYTAGPVTMPADGNLDTKATTNNGGVFANRILVAVSVVTTNIATINRVAYANVSRWVNVAKASIARINGVS